MSLYDPDRDPVRRAGSWLRWGARWIAVPVVLGVFVSSNMDARSLPLFGPERESAVLFLDGQAYFGHLDDSGDGGTLVLRDVYYFANATGSLTGLPVGLVKRGTEAHEPADGMRINRDRVLAIEQVGPAAPVMQAIGAERQIVHASPALISLNRMTIGAASTLTAQRVAAEHDVQRGYAAAVDQLAAVFECRLGREFDFAAGVAVHFFNTQHITGCNPVLLAARFDNRVHAKPLMGARTHGTCRNRWSKAPVYYIGSGWRKMVAS